MCEHPDNLIPNIIIPFRDSISSREKPCFQQKKQFSTLTLTITITVNYYRKQRFLARRAGFSFQEYKPDVNPGAEVQEIWD